MKKALSVIGILLLSCMSALATWSVIIIDPKTKEIGIVGASCSYNCYGIGTIIPNMGAVIVQAMSNKQAREKGVQMVIARSSPAQIIQAMRNPAFDPELQQYAVVTLQFIASPANYTGQLANGYKGALIAKGVSVQGNTLANEDQLKIILNTVLEGQKKLLDIAETLMNALEAGSVSGGDKRCGDQKATSAFIMVARANDKKPYLNLSIFGQSKGGQNAVILLRRKFVKWKSKHKVAK